MSWRVARSLDVLLEEINAAAPRRSKVSDGSIGDAAHASRDSDHNPWVTLGGQGIVRARDFTHDPAGGLDCNDLAKALAALIAVGGHPACRSGAYVIWNRRILSFDRRGEGWRTYTGSNPHDHHCHISVALDPAGFDSRAMWGVMTEEDDMASPEVQKQLDRIEKSVKSLSAAEKRRAERATSRHKAVKAELDAIEAEANDDDEKALIRRVRDRIVKAVTAADDTEEN